MSLKQIDFNHSIEANYKIYERELEVTKNIKNTKLIDKIKDELTK